MNSLFKFNNMPLVTSKKWQSMMSCWYLNRWKVTSFRINDDTTYDFFFQTLPESLKISINMSGTCLSSLWQSLHARIVQAFGSLYLDSYRSPAIQAVMKQATFPAIIALTTTCASAVWRRGAIAPKAPSMIPMELMLEKPHRA